MPRLTQPRSSKRKLATQAKRDSANRTRSRQQKDVSASNEVLWWRSPDADMPALPLPTDKVDEKDLPAAKLRAIQAVQEWGVWVEASRASRMGRWQLMWQARSDADFKKALLAARAECFERLEREMIKRGQYKGGDLAAIFTMKNNMRRYREIQRLEVTGKDGSPLQAFDAAKAALLDRLTKLASAGSGGSQGLEGLTEIQVGGSGVSGSAGSQRPRLVAGSEAGDVRRANSKRRS